MTAFSSALFHCFLLVPMPTVSFSSLAVSYCISCVAFQPSSFCFVYFLQKVSREGLPGLIGLFCSFKKFLRVLTLGLSL